MENLSKIESFLAQPKILPFCEQSSYVFAKYKSQLKKTGNIIADLALMIASISKQNDMVLVTNNMKHFIGLQT